MACIGWTELCSTDPDASARFYARLLGWERRPQELTHGARTLEYSLFTHGERNVAGMHAMVGAQRKRGTRPHWLCHVFIEDLVAGMERARSRGGHLLSEPLDVLELGRLALLRDPQGALFGLWEPRQLGSEFQTRGELGCASWFEHVSADARAAAQFYAELCGWSAPEPRADEPLRTLEHAGEPLAGMRSIDSLGARLAPQWLPYFRVANCDETCGQLESLRASVLLPPAERAPARRGAVALDPTGAPVGLLSSAEH
jgi:predicted enzyme related to lactoylglutathione lyase